jgi:hypothetical protein
MAETAETPAAPAGSPGAAGAAREEVARQVVALVGGVAFVLAAVAAERYATDPDAFRTARMRAAQVVERAAMRCARAAAGLAARADQVYRDGCRA